MSMKIQKSKWYVVIIRHHNKLEVWGGPYGRLKDLWYGDYESVWGQEWMKGSDIVSKIEQGYEVINRKR